MTREGVSKTAQRNFESRKIFTVATLEKIRPGTNGEALVDARKYDAEILALPRDGQAETILVRDGVAKKLAAVDRRIFENDGLHLKIVSGYRHPDFQAKIFEEVREALRKTYPDISESELIERAHAFAAYPPVAGHLTGGAVDVSLVRADKELDMGVAEEPFDPAVPQSIETFSEGISAAQLANRLKLCDAMFAQGFTPFFGEWWHFSYGDREWAAFSGAEEAVYGPVYASE
jgi:D-alanyl-D-alanine dipeptidase